MIARLVERGNLSSLWFKVLARGRIYRREILLERPLSDAIPDIDALLPVDISILKAQEVEEYLRFRPSADPVELRNRFNHGHCCFVARYVGRIVSASWTTTQGAWSSYLEREIIISPGDVYGYDSFTDLDFRGQQIATVRLAAMLRFFREAGYVRLVSIVVPENSGARRYQEKMGYRSFGVVGYVKLGPRRWHFCRMIPGARPLQLQPARHGG